jgi:MOSC domain-containing protein YiiM
MDASTFPTARITSVNRSPGYTLIKPSEPQITLLAGLGVEGDAHMGTTVKHRSRVAKDPTQPNLRQVHLIHSELHDEVSAKGMPVLPGQMGENITTRGIDLLGLPKGTVLQLGAEARIEVTGLRNPCHQLNGIQPGLLEAVLDKDAEGNLIRKAGIMAIVLQGGVVCQGDPIHVTLPVGDHEALKPV